MVPALTGAPSQRGVEEVDCSIAWRRDHGRCVVPGCRSARFLDVHHVEYRSEGGDHSPDNLCLLCRAHHKAEHEGRLVICGRVSSGLTFTHADGRPYGTPPTVASGVDPAVIDDAVAALRGTGFTAGQARGAVAAAASHVGVGATLEDLIRGAFQQLHRGARARSSA